ncbi:hypothetical protein ACI65C_012776 [Semiaphis heraclei]
MNSMRLLILLTFILYETQSAPSIQPLKFLKTLISKHLSSTTEQPLLEEEIYPAYKCESVEDDAINDAVIEWNRQVFLVDQKPILIEVGSVGQIQNGKNNDDLAVNPKINPEVNCEENAEVNPEGNFEENLKLSQEKPKNGYEKDVNTQWLLGENTSEKPTETYLKPSIKDQIINKINIIKSKLKSKNRVSIPIEELIEENKNHVGFTSGNPITTLESITTGKPTTVQHITTVQPVTTTHQYSTTAQPFTSTQPIISAQYSTTVKPEGNTPDVQVKYGVESQEPFVTIPTQNQMPLQPQPIYYSDYYYPLWLNNCPPPLSHKICYNQNNYYAPSYYQFTDKLNENQFTLENTPYNTPVYQNQKINNGLTKVVNYIKIDATQPVYSVKPNQDEQWTHYTYDDTNPIYQNPISYYISAPANPESQPEISGNDNFYSTSTMEPIVVYPVDDNVQLINQVDQAQPEYNLDHNLAPTTVNSNVEVSRTPLRGDIQYGEDVNPNVNYDQPEEDSSDYLLKERRSVGQYNNDKKHISQKNNLNVPFPVSDISLVKPVSEKAETLTPANKIEIPAVTETKIPINKIETNIANIEKSVLEIENPVVKIEEPVPKIENPVVKIETPAVTSTKIPNLESNNVNIGV